MSLELPEPIVLPEALEPLEPIVLPLLLGVLLEDELLEGVLAEPDEPVVEEPEVDGVVAEPELEPLAPIEVPLLPLVLGELAVELDVSVELEPLALGVLEEELLLGVLAEELLLGVVLEDEDEPAVLGLVVLEPPEAPIELVEGLDGLAPPAAAPGPEALLVPEVVPALVVPPLALVPPALPALPELAMAKPPKARAAAAATVVRVVLIMSISLIQLPTRGFDGKGAGSWRRLDQRLGRPARASKWVYSGRPCRTATVTICCSVSRRRRRRQQGRGIPGVELQGGGGALESERDVVVGAGRRNARARIVRERLERNRQQLLQQARHGASLPAA